jgi:putative oxidoreductase
MGWTSSFFMLIGRLLLAAIFLISAYNKVMNYDGTVAYMTSKGLPMVPLLLGLSILIEFLGGLSLVIGYKIRAFAVLLMLYLIPLTLTMHDFWMVQDPLLKQDQMYHFLKNLAIMGGLLYVASAGAGYLGFDRCGYACRKDKEVIEK